MNGFAPQDKQASEPGFFSSPLGKISVNVVLFVAGVVLIQSPIMDIDNKLTNMQEMGTQNNALAKHVTVAQET
ncbi:hypothetical protein C6P40_001694, partial [Pichia californica]